MPIRTTFAMVPYNATILIAYGMNTKKTIFKLSYKATTISRIYWNRDGEGNDGSQVIH